MFVDSKRRRLLGRAVVCAGLVLGAMGFANGIASAIPSQPVPADIPFLPSVPDPGSGLLGGGSGLLGGGSGLLGGGDPVGMLTNAGGVMPLFTDAESFLSAPQGNPGSYMTSTQNLLNDVGNLLGVPSAGSFLGSMPVGGAPVPGAPPVPAFPGAAPPAFPGAAPPAFPGAAPPAYPGTPPPPGY